jgi:hydroxymethylpyrimidine pyrophosphatase-like HAD family hydrolase
VNDHQKIRLLLADVDGRLVTQDKVLTEATRAAAVELHEAGLMLAITSGRPPRGIEHADRTTQSAGPREPTRADLVRF